MDLTVQVPDDATPVQLQRWKAQIENLVRRWRSAERLPVAPGVQDVPEPLEGDLTLGTEPSRMPDHSLSQRVRLRAPATNVGAVIVWDHRPGPTSPERVRLAPGQRSQWIVVGHQGMPSLWVAAEHAGDSVAFVSSRTMG